MSEVTFSEFSGINNVTPQQRLTKEDLVAAVNVDLDEARRLSRRAGSTVVNAGAAHSLFSNGEYALFRRGSSLYRMDVNGAASLLGGGFTSSDPCAYVPVAGGVFLSDGTARMWTDGHDLKPWGIEPPAAQPTSSGTGRLYALTFLRADGEESGTIEAEEGGTSFTDIPVSSDPSVTEKAIYLTEIGGTQLFRAMVIPNAQTSAGWGGGPLGKPLTTMLQIPPPPSNVLAMDHGRLVMGFGSFVLYTDPYSLERYSPDHNFIPFESRVRMIVKADGGRYVTTDKGIYWLAGPDIATATVKQITDYGTPAGSHALVDGALLGEGIPERVPVFPTHQGFVAALPGGQLQNLTIKRFWPTASKWVSSAYVREAGKNRALFFFLT